MKATDHVEPHQLERTPELFPVLCSWCEARGRRRIVQWSEVENSSGICRDCHRRELEAGGLFRGSSRMGGEQQA
jgi:hypothetical protein